jgi:hypothetical protein
MCLACFEAFFMDGTGANLALSGFTVLLHNLLEFFIMLVVFRDSTVLHRWHFPLTIVGAVW